jgi:hypothetical protein
MGMLDRLRTTLGDWKARREPSVALQGLPAVTGTRVKAKVSMNVAVRRFQGTFICGCKADPLKPPDECPIHLKPRFYKLESSETLQQIVEIPKEED